MFEKAPENNINQNPSSVYEDEELLTSPRYLEELIQYLEQKIKIERSLGHSTEFLETEKNEYQEKLSFLKNGPDFKNVA
tara:strand:+ start:1284 stop:1520 length:237 start_codon:yes stop_codon:yes gene_type:complete